MPFTPAPDPANVMKWRWVDFRTANSVLEFLNGFTQDRVATWKIVWNEDFKVYTVFCHVLESEIEGENSSV